MNMYTKYSEKLLFLTPQYAHIAVLPSTRGSEILVF